MLGAAPGVRAAPGAAAVSELVRGELESADEQAPIIRPAARQGLRTAPASSRVEEAKRVAMSRLLSKWPRALELRPVVTMPQDPAGRLYQPAARRIARS
jgi:hypothetical protein